MVVVEQHYRHLTIFSLTAISLVIEDSFIPSHFPVLVFSYSVSNPSRALRASIKVSSWLGRMCLEVSIPAR
jgi:hypothetical protein